MRYAFLQWDGIQSFVGICSSRAQLSLAAAAAVSSFHQSPFASSLHWTVRLLHKWHPRPLFYVLISP